MPLSKNAPARLREWLLSGQPPRPSDPAEAEPLARDAREQGLLGLLDAALEADLAPWPPAVRRALRDGHRALLLRGVRQLDLMGRVQDLFERRGLRALPLKGAALAETYYDSVGERPMSDVDALALDDWTASVRALSEVGFAEVGRADHAWSFVDPATGERLELHHSVCSCTGLYPVDGEGLWSRTRPGAGQVPRLPSAEDLLVQLSLHAAFQHGLVLGLVQYLDFRRILERSPVDPDRLLELAARSRAMAVLAVSLEAAAAVVGAPVPTHLREGLRAALPRPLGRWLDRRLAEPLSFLIPARARIGGLRWLLARGRRLDLVRRTVLSPLPGPGEPALRRALGAAARVFTLIRRWGIAALRS